MAKLQQKTEQGTQFSINFFDNLKTCNGCGLEKDENNFSKINPSKKNPKGLHSLCHECRKEYQVKMYYSIKGRTRPEPKIYNEGELKTCIKCNTPKALKSFNKCDKTRLNPQGINNSCRECCIEVQKVHYKKRYIKKPKVFIEFPKRTEKIRKPMTHEPIKGEKWKSVKGLAGKYMVSNKGRVFSMITNKIIKPSLGSKGYHKIRIGGKSRFVHRIVAIAFLYNPLNKPEVNHKDTVKTNNNLTNLEWCTGLENRIHYEKFKRKNKPKKVRVSQKGKGSVRSKPFYVFDENKAIIKKAESQNTFAQEINVCLSSVQKALNRNGKCKEYYLSYCETIYTSE